ncbi:MAG TPA: 50S ribosomal protein L30 [Terriglobia bacterium]|nr:50S ribosomal protein L30 [Terriglobia bacterium]
MAKKKSKTIFVRWVRSGIGFSYHQKRMVRSLGLRHLNHVVELEDNPAIRGLVAKVPHLVEITTRPEQPAHASIPEFTIRAASVAPSQTVESMSSVEPAATPEPAAKAKRVRKKKETVIAGQPASDSPDSGAPGKSEE